MPIPWNREIKNLGTTTDSEIAERLGVTKERVRQVRNELNIPRAPRRLRRPEREVGSDDIVRCLRAVPLSAADRQLLTDVRIARGWSQTELASRLRSSLAFVHAIETGKKSPSPEYLARMCAALGLEWQLEFRLQLIPKRRKRRRS